mmetsp:Transcript_27695/g.45663  ORF Transcript_27695/g.45663 Transcript_27695/m.45663 type:complete len:251 (-) Transcript_27695:200-952(-)
MMQMQFLGQPLNVVIGRRIGSVDCHRKRTIAKLAPVESKIIGTDHRRSQQITDLQSNIDRLRTNRQRHIARNLNLRKIIESKRDHLTRRRSARQAIDHRRMRISQLWLWNTAGHIKSKLQLRCAIAFDRHLNVGHGRATQIGNKRAQCRFLLLEDLKITNRQLTVLKQHLIQVMRPRKRQHLRTQLRFQRSKTTISTQQITAIICLCIGAAQTAKYITANVCVILILILVLALVNAAVITAQGTTKQIIE